MRVIPGFGGEFQGYDFGGQSLRSGLGNTLHQYADKRSKLQNFRDDMSLRSRLLIFNISLRSFFVL